MRFTKITIISTKKPRASDINEQLQWFGGTLGLFGNLTETNINNAIFSLFCICSGIIMTFSSFIIDLFDLK